jgi:hypothetical protein
VVAIAVGLIILALLLLLVGGIWISVPLAIVGLALLVASRTGIGRRGRRAEEPRS